MAEFRLGRLKFNWRGVWTPDTAYVIDDIITLGGNSYVCTINHTSASREDLWYVTDYNIATPRWAVHTEGTRTRGDWAGLTTYSANDVFSYGNTQYRVTIPHFSSDVGVVSFQYTTEYLSGTKGEGGYDPTATYQKGDIITYNGSAYIGIATNAGVVPPLGIGTAWNLLVTGISTSGISTYAVSANYRYGDIVSYGGDTYIGVGLSIPFGARPTGYGVTSADNWQLLVKGLKYSGSWSTTTEYQINDVISFIASSYVSVASSNLGKEPATSWATGNWSLLADGSSAAVLSQRGDLITRDVGSPVRLGIGSTGTALRSTGLDAIWDYYGNAPSNYYVNNAGNDWPQWGTTPETAWASLNYAVSQVETPAVIHVAAGTYSEQLPIVVPASCDIRGASQREVFIQPANAGFSTGTMFQLSDACIVSELTVRGMAGWAKTTGNPEDILKEDTGEILIPPKGIFFAFNPASPIATKSPYVKDCSGIGTGCIGVYLDGNIHASGNKSMVFHAFTVLTDSGIGYWIDNNAKAEVVSGFSYWADYGYLCTNGGIIRALNGNNSYGTWGAASLGYSQTETPQTGSIDGELLEYQTGTLVVVGQGVTIGAAITGGDSGARGVIIYDIESTNRVAFRPVGVTTFSQNEVIYIGPDALVSSGATARLLNNTDFFSGVKGYLIPLKGLIAEPRARGGLQFSGVSTSNPVTRRTSGSLYGPGASSGSVITAGVGSDTSAYTVSEVTEYIAPTYGLAGYAGTYYLSSLGSVGNYPSVAVSSGSTGSGAYLNISIGATGYPSQISISTAGSYYTQNESITIDGNQIGGVTGTAITFNASTIRGTAIVRLSSEKVNTSQGYDGQSISIRYDFSQIRLTGHDFLDVGIGNRADSNYPGKPLSTAITGNQVVEGYPGRVYYVSTDQDGNFRVGQYFAVDQATGSATLNAAAFNLSGLTSLRLGSLGGQIGEAISEFSSDPSLSGNSNTAVPTEYAVKTYVDTQITKSRGFAYWVGTS